MRVEPHVSKEVEETEAETETKIEAKPNNEVHKEKT